MNLEELTTLVKDKEAFALEGVSEATLYRRVQAGQYTRLRKGIYVDTSHLRALRFEERAVVGHIAAHRTIPSAVFSHDSAALLWGAALLKVPRRVSISTPGRSRNTPSGTIRHASRRQVCERARVVAGLPVTDPIQTIIDCAVTLPALDALVVADSLVRLGLCTVEDAAPQLGALAGVRGARTARTLLECMSGKSESPAESLAVYRIRAMGLEQPEQQITLRTSNGYTYRPDFLWQHQRLILEVDGMVKYYGGYRPTDEELRYENFRQKELTRDGWRVVRTTWDELLRQPNLLRAELVRAGVRPL